MTRETKESKDYKKSDNLEENQMLDTLSWALNFMRRYEDKKEKQHWVRLFKIKHNL